MILVEPIGPIQFLKLCFYCMLKFRHSVRGQLKGSKGQVKVPSRQNISGDGAGVPLIREIKKGFLFFFFGFWKDDLSPNLNLKLRDIYFIFIYKISCIPLNFFLLIGYQVSNFLRTQ